MRKSFILGLFLGVITLLTGCGGSTNRFKKEATLDEQAAKINFARFDSTIFDLDQCITRPAVKGNYDLLTANIPDSDSLCLQQKINAIKSQYPTQFKHYMMMLDEMSSGYDTPYETLFYLFLSHEAYHELYSDCIKRFEKDEDIKAEFTKAFSRAKQFFPGYEIPENIFFIFSGFGDYLAIDENTFYVSLEYFLGSDYDKYKYMQGIYNYQIKNMTREKIVTDAIYECTCEQFPLTKEAGNLLDNLIYYGKMLYITDAIMQDKDSKNIIGYSDDEWKWCVQNEKNMWSYLRENNLLFSTDNKLITDFTIMSPSTKYFSTTIEENGTTKEYNAPGRAAIWLGWQIVAKYMENNPTMDLEALIAQKDAQMILNGSRYNP